MQAEEDRRQEEALRKKGKVKERLVALRSVDPPLLGLPANVNPSLMKVSGKCQPSTCISVRTYLTECIH